MCAVRQLDDFYDIGHHAIGVEVLYIGILYSRISLAEYAYRYALLIGGVDCTHCKLPPHHNGKCHLRKKHHVAKWYHRQVVKSRCVVLYVGREVNLTD